MPLKARTVVWLSRYPCKSMKSVVVPVCTIECFLDLDYNLSIQHEPSILMNIPPSAKTGIDFVKTFFITKTVIKV